MDLTKAIFERGRVLSFLKWNTYGRLTSLISRFKNKSQYKKVHEDLLEEDKFLMIVLDSCRYDFFEATYDIYLDEGDLERVYSTGRLTFEYVANMWEGDYKDILYISGIGVINSRIDERMAEKIETNYPHGYVPKNNLRIEDVNSKGWNEELKAVPPEEITHEVMDSIEDEDKIVAHFQQPHDPYIGDYRLQDVLGEEEFRPLNSYQTWDLYRNGVITQDELRKAYRSNLVRVLKEVARLVEEVDDRRIVVTADHGEMLGECGIVAHPRKEHHLLREVPWLEVK
jgi:hypothetical protein